MNKSQVPSDLVNTLYYILNRSRMRPLEDKKGTASTQYHLFKVDQQILKCKVHWTFTEVVTKYKKKYDKSLINFVKSESVMNSSNTYAICNTYILCNYIYLSIKK